MSGSERRETMTETIDWQRLARLMLLSREMDRLEEEIRAKMAGSLAF
jgi:hypothetical protein